MKKLFSLFAALTLCVGLWANELDDAKADAIAEIEFAIVGVTDTDILAIAEKAKQDINAATTEEAVISIKTFALTKINALVLIQTARQGIQNTEINKMIDGAVNDIEKGGPDATPGIDEIKDQIMTIIELFQDGKTEGIEEGKAAGLAEAAAALPTDPEGTTGHTVTITKGEKTLILVNPDKVTYGKQD